MFNRFICGDCNTEIQRLIDEGIKVDAVIADIPYYQVVKNDWDNQWQSLAEYLEWFDKVAQNLVQVTKEDASVIIFTGRQYNRQLATILDKYFEEKRIIIWARKRNINTTRGKALASGYEPICYYTKGNPTFNNLKIQPDTKRKEYTNGILKDGISLSDVWSDISALPHNAKEKVDHPTQKPLLLMQRCINLVTQPNDLVLDFCSGSGTTGLAARLLGRSCICIEKSEDYYKLALKRSKEIFGD